MDNEARNVLLVAVTLGGLVAALLSRKTPAPLAPSPGNLPDVDAAKLAEAKRIAAFYRIPEGRVVTAFSIAHKYGAKFAVDVALLMAIAQTESTFDASATNPSDPSYGLCGIQTFWIDGRMGFTGTVGQLHDADFNLFVAANIILYFERRHPFKNAGRVFKFPEEIGVYNLGEPAYAKRDQTSADENYAAKVKGFYQRWIKAR